jgi:protein tyrosine phosphatase (PTP) superfamily phosphohydrolase (DUF442 family)
MNGFCSSLLRVVAALLLVLAGIVPTLATPSELPGIHNFFRATTNVFSGSQPEGDAAFAALAKLGVKTLISVDGARPDVELAAKHGLRYVHLPFGYDGISTNRVAELAKVVTVLPGPVYVHCHHGKHRGPAAVSVICLADEGWTTTQAEAFLHQAGTGAEYQGLYRAARDFKPPTAEQLASVSTNFPAVMQPSSLVEVMVAMDEIQEHLKLAQSAGWKTPPNHPDIAPQHEALMLLEHFREQARTPETAKRPRDYRQKLQASTHAAEELVAQLQSGAGADAQFKRLSQSCTDCHRRHRNE